MKYRDHNTFPGRRCIFALVSSLLGDVISLLVDDRFVVKKAAREVTLTAVIGDWGKKVSSHSAK